MSRWGESYGKWVQLMIPNEVLLLQTTCLGHLASGMGCLGEGYVGILATVL